MNDDQVPAAVKSNALSPGDEALGTGILSTLPLTTVKTYSCKVRPCAQAWLDQAAREVNQVWNYCNALTAKSAKPFYGPGKIWSAFDMNHMLTGCGEVFQKIGIDIAQCVAAEHAARRRQFKTSKLRFRHSGGRKRSLGWIPFKVPNLRFKTPKPEKQNINPSKKGVKTGRGKKAAKATGNTFQHRPGRFQLSFMGKTIRLFNEVYLFDAVRTAQERGLKIGQGSFSQDALGDWYLNVPVETPVVYVEPLYGPDSSVGLDPGCKAAMTASDGTALRSRRYRDMEPKIQQAQKTGHKKKAKRLNRKVRRQRLDDRNKFSHTQVKRYARVWAGDIKPQKMIRRGLKGHAKSIHDASWGACIRTLKAMGQRAGRVVEVVSERDSTRRCSHCEALTGPRGLRETVVRNWVCSACEAHHDRDVNAAENIRQRGEALRREAFSLLDSVSRPGVGVRLREQECLQETPAASKDEGKERGLLGTQS